MTKEEKRHRRIVINGFPMQPVIPSWLLPTAVPKGKRARTVLNGDMPKPERKKTLAQMRKGRWRKNHPGATKDLAKLRRWSAENPARAAKIKKRWATRNRGKINAASARYRAKKREMQCTTSEGRSSPE